MTSATLTIIVSLLWIANSRPLQDSTTKDCNYAIDLWWKTATPPSPAPTPEPTNNPTRSPTAHPTAVNETVLNIATDWPDYRGDDGSSGSAISILLFLNPYKIGQCYTFNFTSEPFNQVAWKYTCKDSATLKREIWWDSLECSGIVDTTEISEDYRGKSTQFICDAPKDCAYVDITVVPAITEAPTPEPTYAPTPTPTPYPTVTNGSVEITCALIRNALGGCSYVENLPCQCDDACENRNDCCSDYMDACYDILTLRSEKGGGPFEQCDNVNGPQPNADAMYEWRYATNICVNMYDFWGIFIDDENITEYNGTVYNIGWQCIDNTVYMALFNGSDCGANPMKYIQYSDNKCTFDGGAWATVYCSDNFQTPKPTPKPTRRPSATPTSSPITTAGCREQCTNDEVCVLTTGECESKIVETDCDNHGQCKGDDYKCNADKGFCYLSQCENAGDCTGSADAYECDRIDGKYGDVEYKNGICKEVPIGNSSGVKQNGVMGVLVLVYLIVGLIVSV